MTTSQKTENELIISNLKKLGKNVSAGKDFTFLGEGNVGPIRFDGNPDSYEGYVSQWADDQRQETVWTFKADATYADGACAFCDVANEVFGGFTGRRSMFTPPQMMEVDISHDERRTVPIGRVSIGAIKCELKLSDKCGKFVVEVCTVKAHEETVRGFFKLVELRLKEYSIYRGKSLEIDSAGQVSFVCIPAIDEADTFYEPEVLRALKANVWTTIQNHSAVVEAGLVAKSSVLLHGPYGTGKSLAGNLTAQVAERSGWTYIHVPHDAHLTKAFAVAKKLQPAVLMIEDLDIRMGKEAQDSTVVMDALDGTKSKGAEIVVIMTTNHPERLRRGVWRKGRIDEQIKIDVMKDGSKICEMVRHRLGASCDITSGSDWRSVAESLCGLAAAYVDATCRSSRLYAISDGRDKITASDIVCAAKQAREQLSYQEQAKAYGEEDTPTIDSIVRDLVGELSITLDVVKDSASEAENSADGARNAASDAESVADDAKCAANEAVEEIQEVGQHTKKLCRAAGIDV